MSLPRLSLNSIQRCEVLCRGDGSCTAPEPDSANAANSASSMRNQHIL